MKQDPAPGLVNVSATFSVDLSEVLHLQTFQKAGDAIHLLTLKTGRAVSLDDETAAALRAMLPTEKSRPATRAPKQNQSLRSQQ